MTHAPLIAGGMLITGISGGEYGTRGFINGWDLKTGEKKWTAGPPRHRARRAATPGSPAWQKPAAGRPG